MGIRGLLIILLLNCPWALTAQIDLSQGWTFRTGDNPSWSNPGIYDNDWDHIQVGKNWESQGHPGYDGYAWYRLHVTIPSSLRDSSYLKETLRFELGKIDDGDQVFLNGKLIGQNAGKTTDITQGQYDAERRYSIPLNDPSIHWDADNVIAVRVFDHGGDGGMWAGPYTLKAGEVTDYLSIDDQTHPFLFRTGNRVRKSIILKAGATHYIFSGTLSVQIEDPANGATVWQKTVPVHTCTEAQPFRYLYAPTLPDQKAYLAIYTFHDTRSGKDLSAQEGVPYILTPPPSPLPRINGAPIVGERPGHPFLFKVPATGESPIAYHAKGLPQGLKIDTSTGVITGTVTRAGTYTVHLWASNHLGQAIKDLSIVIGDQIALTPALGWNSWNCWGLSVSDTKVRAAADAMKRSGLIDHGWTYINIDDGWERPTRAQDGAVVANSKFPDMTAMTAYVHSLGLRVGIYSSPGPRTCGGYMGSYQHELQDAETYATWGIDYLKYDWCSYGEIVPHPDLEALQKPYRVMREALDKVDRDILFSFCQYGMGDVWKWGAGIGGNSWRTTGDINDSWESLSSIGFRQDVCAPYTQPGHWNDPDMLVVGKVGWGPSLHNTRLTPDEQYTHISLWCLLSAPLLIGCDMSQMDDFTRSLLSNDEVLAIDQDALGKGATKASVMGDIQVWTKALQDGSLAVGIFNLSTRPQPATVNFSDLGLSGSQSVRDCWRQKDLGTVTGHFDVRTVPAHGVVLVRLKQI